MAVTKTETTPSFAARKRLDPLRDGIDRQTERERERERESERVRDTRGSSQSQRLIICAYCFMLHIGVARFLRFDLKSANSVGEWRADDLRVSE